MYLILLSGARDRSDVTLGLKKKQKKKLSEEVSGLCTIKKNEKVIKMDSVRTANGEKPKPIFNAREVKYRNRAPEVQMGCVKRKLLSANMGKCRDLYGEKIWGKIAAYNSID